MSKVCLFNCVTTGNSMPGCYESPIAFDAMLAEVDGKGVAETKSLSMYIVPESPVTLHATAFTGLDESNLDGAVSIHDGLLAISRMFRQLANKNIYLVGWNILEVIQKNLEPHMERVLNESFHELFSSLKVIDLRQVAQAREDVGKLGQLTFDSTYLRMFGRKNLASMKLKRCESMYCRIVNEMSAKILSKYMEELEAEKIEDVEAYVGQPHLLARMPFGKYRNYEFADLLEHDSDYLIWLRSCSDITTRNKDLKFTLDKLLS